MGTGEILQGLEQELRRGTLVMCVLDRLHTPMYGYALVTELQQKGIGAETNTLYPLLRRLEGQGLLESSWNTDEAKPRKYYCITMEGRRVYEGLRQVWLTSTQSIHTLLEEKHHEQ